VKRIAIIPARGGSRRIPGKNIKMFHGKPIIAYSIETARRSGLFDTIAVCTDSNEIGAVAEHYGAWRLTRSEASARDEVGTQEVMRHAITLAQAIKDTTWDQACCIYATAPMMTVPDLVAATVYLQEPRRYAFAVSEEPFGPAGMFYLGAARDFLIGHPLVQPQAVMIPIPATRCIDINTHDDWERAEKMYADWRDNAERNGSRSESDCRAKLGDLESKHG
jgi:pseudaminic acid cytidylyltransferase